MINLKVNNNQVVLPAGASISIEKNSPVLNDEVGAFSYPFPVPTAKNQKLLGYPGRLERAGDLSSKSFILDESGIQIIRGQVEFDKVTASETGIILQSGNNEFSKMMKGKKLSDLDFGSEAWFTEFTNATINAKFAEWNAYNSATDVDKYVVCPVNVTDTSGNAVIVNEPVLTGGTAHLSIELTSDPIFNKYFYLQFSISWILQKIYESAGFRVIENQISGTGFKNVCLFSKLMRFRSQYYWLGSVDDDEITMVIGTSGGHDLIARRGPVFARLNYADLMPDCDVTDFVDAAKKLLCITVEINETLKTVAFIFNKDLFLSSAMVVLLNSEITGWEHSEEKRKTGFSFSFDGQDDDSASDIDYKINSTVAAEANKETATRDLENLIVHVTATNRDYICAEKTTDTWYWKEISRLKPVTSGTTEDREEITIGAKIPPQIIDGDRDIPLISGTASEIGTYTDSSEIIFSYFRGVYLINSVVYPTMSFDRYSLDGSLDFVTSLKPAYLYETVYKEFINWKTYRARECTKYLQLTLAEVVQLQWRKRYVISGIAILLNQVNFEVPYRGIVKVNGFTT